MTSMPVGEYRRRWHETGWCVIERVVPPDDLAAAQAALPAAFPTAEEFADAPRLQFPFGAPALNAVALHDAMLDLAVALFETQDPRV